MKRKIILRADGGSKIGLGHVFRLLALAEMLKDVFECVFAINNPDSFTLTQIKNVCHDVIVLNNGIENDLPDNNKANEEIVFDLAPYITGNTIIVTDGYLFGEKYQIAVKATGAKLVCIDDLGEINFYADIIINHAPGVEADKYKKQSYTKLFTGIDYAIIRKPFFNKLIKKDDKDNNAFISLGGSDFFQNTKKLVELLLPYQEFKQLNILCSASFDNAHLKYLEQLQLNERRIKLHYNINADDLVALLDHCTHSFVAASTVLIESFSRGLKCFTGYYTKNQMFIYNGFIKMQYAEALGSFAEITPSIFEKAIQQENIQVLKAPLESSNNLKSIFSSL